MSWLDDETAELDWLGAHEERSLVPRVVSPIAVPAEAGERNALLEKAWQGLRGKQQTYLDALRRHGFNKAATLRALEITGDAPHRLTVYKWTNEDQDFMFVLKVMKSIARDEVVDPDKLLLRADDIAEQALTPKPILYKGEPTGYYENQPDVALRANEQLMKTQRMLGGEQEEKTFGGRSLTLVVQVVQSDGTLKDVTPSGVLVNVAQPDGLTGEG